MVHSVGSNFAGPIYVIEVTFDGFWGQGFGFVTQLRHIAMMASLLREYVAIVIIICHPSLD